MKTDDHVDLLAEQLQELLNTAASLYANRPDSRAFFMVGRALAGLGRWDELEVYVARRLKKDPRDQFAIRFRLQAALDHADVEAVRRQEDLLRQSEKPQVVDLNNLAWLALITDRVRTKSAGNASRGHPTVTGKLRCRASQHGSANLCGDRQAG